MGSCANLSTRGPASASTCEENGVGCPFLIVGHRGAPVEEAENTIPAFEAALALGANALEIDLVTTKDNQVAVYHDQNPNDLISLVRQSGLEGLKYVPSIPNIGSKKRVTTDELTLSELKSIYGYGLSKGIVGDMFLSNTKDPKAVIPSLQEFATWADTQPLLEAVFLDMKVVPGQEDRAILMANQFADVFANSHYRVYMLTAYDAIWLTLRKWIDENPNAANRFLTLDNEKPGALRKRNVLKDISNRKVQSLAIGATIYMNWKVYLKELEEIMHRSRRRRDMIYPVISWTIDDDKKLYQLLQHGVDGILTNRPDRLHRLLFRHWKDHSLSAKTLAACYQNAQRGKPWEICATGSSLSPVGPIGLVDIRNWVCEEKDAHATLKDFYGCNGIFDKQNIQFTSKIENDPKMIMFSAPNGNVEITNISVKPKEGDQIVFVEYKQESCNDGVFNYKCEFLFEAEYLQQGKWNKIISKVPKKDSFYHPIVVPKLADKIRISIRETDDGKVSDGAAITVLNKNGSSFRFRSPGGAFQGTVAVTSKDATPWLRGNSEMGPIALEFRQKNCNDGVLNYNCEYKLDIEVINADETFEKMQTDDLPLKGSFVVYANVPKTAKGLKLTMKEMDGNVISAQTQFYIESVLDHGVDMYVDSGDGTFMGDITIKQLDYNEMVEGSESDTGFNPHDQLDRDYHKRYRMLKP